MVQSLVRWFVGSKLNGGGFGEQRRPSWMNTVNGIQRTLEMETMELKS